MRAASILALILALLGTLPGVSASGASGPPPRLRAAQAPSSGPQPSRAPADATQGVVLTQAGGTLMVLARGNALLTVIVAGTAAVRGSGNGRQGPRGDLEIARGSVVEIAGLRNSDGSLSARTIAVLFDARRAAHAGGRIVRPAQGGGLLLSDGTVVTLGDDLWIVRGTTLLSADALAPGATVVVYGTAKGSRLVARVIDVSL